MKKDAFYFPHFCNARHDRKLKRVQKELGIEGYGIYFMLLEVLREQTDLKYPLGEIDLLADEFGTSEQKIRVVICNYDLFEVDEKQNFFSIKMIFYLQPYFQKSERAREAANKRWGDANAYANALQMECDSNASKVKESKVNKSKEEETEKFNAKAYMCSLGYEKDLIDQWFKVRKTKKSVNTEIAINSFHKEVLKINPTNVNEILRTCIEKSWAGFKSEWLKNVSTDSNKPKMVH